VSRLTFGRLHAVTAHSRLIPALGFVEDCGPSSDSGGFPTLHRVQPSALGLAICQARNTRFPRSPFATGHIVDGYILSKDRRGSYCMSGSNNGSLNVLKV
jgi:hypothetical protein